MTGAKVQDGTLGTSDISGTRGTVTINTPDLTHGQCTVVATTVRSLQSGDQVIVNEATPAPDYISWTPMTASTGNLRLRICNRDTTLDYTSIPAFDVTYLTLRP